MSRKQPFHRRHAPPSLQGNEVTFRPTSPRKEFWTDLECNCNSDGEKRMRTPLGGYGSARQGQGYKHLNFYKSLIDRLRRARGPKARRSVIATAPDNFIRFLASLSRKLVSGAVRVSAKHRRRLLPYGSKLIQFAKTKNVDQLRHRASTGGKSQKGGILPIIPFLLSLGPLIAKGLAIGAATAVGGTVVKKIVDSGKNDQQQVPKTGSGAYQRQRYYYD